LTIEKVNSNKSPGIDQILAELFKASGGTFRSEVRKIIISIWNKEELSEEWNESITDHLFIRRAIKHIVIITGAYHFFQLRTKFYPTFSCQI